MGNILIKGAALLLKKGYRLRVFNSIRPILDELAFS